MAAKKPVKSLSKQASTAAGRAVGDAARKAQMTRIIMENTGWRGKDLETAVAIMLRESGGNPNSFNGNRATGDESYGLFQINMKDALGPARLKLFGITDRNDLLDPATNARAAYALYQQNGNTFHPWLGYRAGLTVSKQSQEAKDLLARAGSIKTSPGQGVPLARTLGRTAGTTTAAGQSTVFTATSGGRQGSPSIAARSAAPATSTKSNVAQYENGRIPTDQLVPLTGGGMLEANAAAAYNRMYADAQAQGIPLGVTDSYRTYEQQVDLVRRKGLYSSGGLGATPGTSQHGWGQAIDVKGGPAVQAWLKTNASRYGFTADTPREAWHFTYTGPGAVAPRTQRGTTSPTPSGQEDAHGDGYTSGDPIEDQLRGELGWMSAFLDDPEIGSILRQSVGDPSDPADDWTDEQLNGALMDTDWWRTTQASAREFDGLMKTDPASMNAKISSKMQEIQAMATQAGYSIDPGHLRDLATSALRLQMNDQQIVHAIGGESLRYKTLGTSGTSQNVRSLISSYGVPMSETAVNQWSQNIAVGNATTEDLRQQLVNQAKGLYPGFTDGLDRGLTVRALADPYIQLAASNLEVSPDSISISDPKWSGAFQSTDPKTGARGTLPLDQFQQRIRSDPNFGWQNTKGARDQTYNFAAQLGKAFGTYAGTTG